MPLTFRLKALIRAPGQRIRGHESTELADFLPLGSRGADMVISGLREAAALMGRAYVVEFVGSAEFEGPA